MEQQNTFNAAAYTAPRGLYNAEKPLVLLDTYNLEASRGDVHGYKGLAQRVANKTGADVLHINNALLKERYSHIPDAENLLYDDIVRKKRLMALFNDTGFPDFIFFPSYCGTYPAKEMGKENAGLIIGDTNENIPNTLGLLEKNPDFLVPHHLTPEMYSYEGNKFADEYQELPRPFIGILLADTYPIELTMLCSALKQLPAAYKEATFFVVSNRRADQEQYDRILSTLAKTCGDRKESFPVVDYNYAQNIHRHGITGKWNPYIGLLDQSDHIIMSGNSFSMISEALSTGKAVHTCFAREDYYTTGHLRKIFTSKAGRPLVTPSIGVTDITGACADSIIECHKSHIRNLCLPAPPRTDRYLKL